MKEGVRNILLTILAVILLAGFALAVPSGNVNEELYEKYEEENEPENDEFDFL